MTPRSSYGFAPIILLFAFHLANLSSRAQTISGSAEPAAPISRAVIRTLNLQETDDAVITSISHAEFSPSGAVLAIVERGSGHVLLYNAATGMLIRSLLPGPELTDSLVLQTKPLMRNGITPLSHSDVKSGNYGVDYTHPIYGNYFTSCSFLTDSSLALYGLIKPAIWNAERRNIAVGLDAAAILFDLPTAHASVIPIGSNESFLSKNPTNHYPQSWTFLYDRRRQDFITSAAYIKPSGQFDFDSTRYLARYSRAGLREEEYLPPPSEIRHAEYADKLQSVAAAFDENGDLLATLDILPRVYNVTKGTSFDIDGLGVDNGEFFKVAAAGRLSLDSLASYLRVRISNVAVTKRQTILIPVTIIPPRGSSDTEHWYLREYGMDGTLRSNVEIPPGRPDARIRYVGYSNADDAIFVASLSSGSGWWITMIR